MAVLPLAVPGFTFSCPVLFLLAVSLVLELKSGDEELGTKIKSSVESQRVLVKIH